MTLLFTVLAIGVLGLVVAVALGRIGGGLAEPASSVPPSGLPEADLHPDDLDGVRFAPALRGYRMEQVDQVIDRLRDELSRREAEIQRLRGELARVDLFHLEQEAMRLDEDVEG